MVIHFEVLLGKYTITGSKEESLSSHAVATCKVALFSLCLIMYWCKGRLATEYGTKAWPFLHSSQFSAGTTMHRHQTGIPAERCSLLGDHQHFSGLRSFELGEWAGFHIWLLAVSITGSYSRTECSLWATKGVCVPIDPWSSVRGVKKKNTLRVILHVVISAYLLAITMLNNLLYDKKLSVITWDMKSALELHGISLVPVGACPSFLPLDFRTSFHHKMAHNLLWVEFSLDCNSKALRFN